MFLKTHLPCFLLRPYIRAIIEMEIEENIGVPYTDNMLPFLGGGLTFLFKKSGPVVLNSKAVNNYENPIEYLSSAFTHPIKITHSGGHQFISVMFEPGAFSYFFPIPISEFINRNISF